MDGCQIGRFNAELTGAVKTESHPRAAHAVRVLKMLIRMCTGLSDLRALLRFPTPKALRSKAQGRPQKTRPTLGSAT